MRFPFDQEPDAAEVAAEGRVRALRDALQSAAERLESAEPAPVGEIHEAVLAACAGILPGDMGRDGVVVGQQMEAMLERFAGIAAAHPEPLDTSSLGLPGDARFLRDMAEFVTRRYGLDEESSPKGPPAPGW